MTSEDALALPLLDQAVLDRLRHELDDDEGLLAVFVRNFIAQLPRRTEHLRLALTTGDLASALDAVLSLKTSSQMVGAERLAGLAFDLERSLRLDTRHSNPERILPRLAAAHLPPIQKCGKQTANLLEKLLHPKPRK